MDYIPINCHRKEALLVLCRETFEKLQIMCLILQQVHKFMIIDNFRYRIKKQRQTTGPNFFHNLSDLKGYSYNGRA